jgi:hypothetical protein
MVSPIVVEAIDGNRKIYFSYQIRSYKKSPVTLTVHKEKILVDDLMIILKQLMKDLKVAKRIEQERLDKEC